jgi:hypothetical protein
MIETRHAIILCRILGLICIFSPGVLLAQAPPGPMPPPQSTPPRQEQSAQPKIDSANQAERRPARQSIAGAWKLNRDESDDAREKIRDAQREESTNSPGRGNGPYGGGTWGGGYPFPRPGGGWGGGPSGRNRGGWDAPGDTDFQRMNEFLNPADSVNLTIKDGEVDFSDNQNRKRVFYTDGRKLEKPKDENYREIAAHWEGNRLVAEEKSAPGGQLRRSFELAAEGQKLYETVYLEGTRQRSSVSIRFVYDIGPDKQ